MSNRARRWWQVGVIGCCVSVLGISALDATPAQPPSQTMVSQPCADVVSTEFVGQLCQLTGADRVSYERRQGQWLLPEGGTFRGRASSQPVAGLGQQITKDGYLNGSGFEGDVHLQLDLYGGSSNDRTTRLLEHREGKERLPDGGFFEGTIDTTTETYVGGVRQQSVEKRGRVHSVTFDGRFTSLLKRSRVSPPVETVTETTEGKELWLDGGQFEGTVRRERTTTAQGTTLRVEKNGRWHLASGQQLEGNLTTISDPTGQVVRMDTRLPVGVPQRSALRPSGAVTAGK